MKKLITRTNILIFISITILAILTYSNFTACLEVISKTKEELLPIFLKKFCCTKLDTNYLVAIIAFYGAIIAFFIPFTIDMSNKLKIQFGTEIISKRFESEEIVRTLYIKLLINTFIASVTLLFYKDSSGISLLIFNTIIFFILIYSIIIFFEIYKYVNLLKKYTDTDKVLEMLQEEIENAIE